MISQTPLFLNDFNIAGMLQKIQKPNFLPEILTCFKVLLNWYSMLKTNKSYIDLFTSNFHLHWNYINTFSITISFIIVYYWNRSKKKSSYLQREYRKPIQCIQILVGFQLKMQQIKECYQNQKRVLRTKLGKEILSISECDFE